MRLKRFRVEMFRSIIDSGWVEIDDMATVVGKNESGKTSLLKALWKFNPHGDHPYNLNREWPRGWRSERSPEARVVELEFSFNDSEKEQIAGIHASAEGITGVRIEKDYAGMFSYRCLPHDPDDTHDLVWVGSTLINTIKALPGELSPNFKESYQTAFDDFLKAVRENGGAEYAVEHIEELCAEASKHVHPNEPAGAAFHQADTAAVATLKKHVEGVKKTLGQAPPCQKVVDTVHEWLPVFIYMDDYQQFHGTAQLNQVLERFQQKKARGSDETVRMIMEQAGLDLEEEVQKGEENDREQRMLDMNDASRTLTELIAERWSQRKYEIMFQADGQHFITFVKDDQGSALVPLEERSKGFQWFFSFDMKFMCETDGQFTNAVILLDEPGLHLHASAQRDLLQRMHAYGRSNQLIYTTHLPFMIDSSRLDKVWVCEEDPEKGAVVHQNWATADKDARFTLQAALGLSWSQSLFVGQHNLVVEGVTDFWYLRSMSTLLEQAGEEGLNPDLVITPAGGASKVAYVGTLLHGQDLNVAVLLDNDPAGDSAFAQLVHQWILDEKHVLQIGDVLGKPKPFAIEDLFQETFFLRHVNDAYTRELEGNPLTLTAPGVDVRTIVDRVEAALAERGCGSFNKGRVAKRILTELATAKLEDLAADTVESFAAVIQAVNGLVAAWRASTSEKPPPQESSE